MVKEVFNGCEYCAENCLCEDFMRSCNEGRFDLIVTDPPFGVNFKNDFYDDSIDTVHAKMDDWYEQMFRVLKKDCYLFLFCGVKGIEEWITRGKAHGLTFKNMIATRAFNNGRKAYNNFSFVFQPVLVFSKGKGKAFNKVDLFPTSKEWLNDKRNKNRHKYSYLYPNYISKDIAYGTEVFGSPKSKKIFHPNAKNEKLIRFFVELTTQEKEVVFDPFMGSCTTGTACVKSGRSFTGCELDAKYFEMSCNKIKALCEGQMTLL
jgi:site-specific DNA-methyltransferase (adenine-specific)